MSNKKHTVNFYMHPACMDLCLRELIKPDGSASYEWWNLGYTGEPWPIDNAIVPRNFEQWVNITKLVNMPRREPGLPKKV